MRTERLTRALDARKVAFITCVNDEHWYEECLLYLQSLALPAGMTAEYLPVRGAASMCAGYNEAMMRSEAKYKVYLHQDTLVVNKQLVADLLDIFADETIGAVGVIGCRSLRQGERRLESFPHHQQLRARGIEQRREPGLHTRPAGVTRQLLGLLLPACDIGAQQFERSLRIAPGLGREHFDALCQQNSGLALHLNAVDYICKPIRISDAIQMKYSTHQPIGTLPGR